MIEEQENDKAILEPDVIDPSISLEEEQAIIPNLADFSEQEPVTIEIKNKEEELDDLILKLECNEEREATP